MKIQRPLIYRRTQHLAALAVAVAVFPLIWMGGLVTTHGVGMSVPDWPNTYGYNMFLFPPSKWLGGVFFEHTHRLLGTLAGLLAILLALIAWGPSANLKSRRWIGRGAVIFAGLTVISIVYAIARRNSWTLQQSNDFSHTYVGLASLALIGGMAYGCRVRSPQRWLRWLALAELAAIALQGLFGGLRVDLANINLAILHGCFAQAVFCLTAFTALATSKWWNVGVLEFRLGSAGINPLKVGLYGAIGVTTVIYLQLVAGAIMRHKQAGLAIPTLPLVFGHWLPPADSAGVEAANALRAWRYELPPVTLEQMWMHMAHRIGAVCVTTAALSWAAYVLICLRRERAVVATAVILLMLLPAQVTLGVLTVWLKKPADLTSLHVAVGALTLITASSAVAVTWRLRSRRTATAAVPAPLPAALAVA